MQQLAHTPKQVQASACLADAARAYHHPGNPVQGLAYTAQQPDNLASTWQQPLAVGE